MGDFEIEVGCQLKLKGYVISKSPNSCVGFGVTLQSPFSFLSFSFLKLDWGGGV